MTTFLEVFTTAYSWLKLKTQDTQYKADMSYRSNQELTRMGFKYLGEDVLISRNCRIYDASCIELGNKSRVDDYVILSGNLRIGSNCHITPMCLLAGGREGITLEDFVTLAYGVKVFSQSDDYSGETLTNSTIPRAYKNEKFASVYIGKHVIVGTNAVVFPGVSLGDGTAIGASSVVLDSTEPWHIYAGTPARPIKKRSKRLLSLEERYLDLENE